MRNAESSVQVLASSPVVLTGSLSGPAGDGRRLCDGPSVVAEHDRWTVLSSKVNLPAALNDPRLAKRESDFFTKTWGLDFAETEVMASFYLPNITRDDFGPYLQETAQVTALNYGWSWWRLLQGAGLEMLCCGGVAGPRVWDPSG